MLIIDTLGYRLFRITPDPIELEKNPDLKTLIFEAEPYILANGDEIKLEFHLFQYIKNKPAPKTEQTTGGMGSQDNIGVPGINQSQRLNALGNPELPVPNPLSATSLHLPGINGYLDDDTDNCRPYNDFESLSEIHNHHKDILVYNINYLEIQLNGFKDWLSSEDCITRLFAELKPVNPDNYLISDIIKKLDGFVKQDSIETRLFTPKILISSEYKDKFDFLYNKAQGICYKFQNRVSIFIDIEATLTLLVNNPEYNPNDIICIGDLPYTTSTNLHQTFATKPFVGYSPVQHSIHAIIGESSNMIQIVKTTDVAPGVREARWGIDIASDKIKFIMNINYLID